jgi:DNA-binding CsgD family transcriptional regulator
MKTMIRSDAQWLSIIETVLTGAMDALSIPMFVCDRAGRVGSLTQAPEDLVTSGRGLQLKTGRLRAYREEEAKALDDAIEAAPSQTYQFTFAPRVLVVARGPRGLKARRTAILQAMYALTSTETQIAEYLVEGQSAESIAVKRGVAVQTVRTQIKAIMAKLGVSRQVELVVRLGEL